MTTITDLQMSQNKLASLQSFYLAEAGLQRAVREIAEDEGWASKLADPSNAFDGDNALGHGEYTVEVLVDTPEVGHHTIRSTGTITLPKEASSTVELVGSRGPIPECSMTILGSDPRISVGEDYQGGIEFDGREWNLPDNFNCKAEDDFWGDCEGSQMTDGGTNGGLCSEETVQNLDGAEIWGEPSIQKGGLRRTIQDWTDIANN